MPEYYFTKDELYHHGIKGQKWGVRRFQNPDGSLTSEGMKRYGGGARAEYKNRVGIAKANYKAKDRAIQDDYFKKLEGIEKNYKRGQKLSDKDYARERKLDDKATAAWEANKQKYKAEKKAARDEYKQSDEYKERQAKLKKAAKIGAAAVGTALVAYGGYKLYKNKAKDKTYEKALDYGRDYYEKLFYKNAAASGKSLRKSNEATGHALNKTIAARRYYKEGDYHNARANRLSAEQWLKDAKKYENLADNAKSRASAADSQWRKYSKKYFIGR